MLFDNLSSQEFRDMCIITQFLHQAFCPSSTKGKFTEKTVIGTWDIWITLEDLSLGGKRRTNPLRSLLRKYVPRSEIVAFNNALRNETQFSDSVFASRFSISCRAVDAPNREFENRYSRVISFAIFHLRHPIEETVNQMFEEVCLNETLRKKHETERTYLRENFGEVLLKL